MKQTRSPRERLGLEIAATVPLRANGLLWRVPSQTTDQEYTVNPVQGTCSCTDYGTRKVRCKHLWAVEFTIIRETSRVQKTTPKPTEGGVTYTIHETTKRVLREIDAGRGNLPF